MGRGEGTLVGRIVGVLVGRRVGVGLGVEVGLGVGGRVGVAVGLAVGLSVGNPPCPPIISGVGVGVGVVGGVDGEGVGVGLPCGLSIPLGSGLSAISREKSMVKVPSGANTFTGGKVWVRVALESKESNSRIADPRSSVSNSKTANGTNVSFAYAFNVRAKLKKDMVSVSSEILGLDNSNGLSTDSVSRKFEESKLVILNDNWTPSIEIALVLTKKVSFL